MPLPLPPSSQAPNLSRLVGTGTKYAGFHTQLLGSYPMAWLVISSGLVVFEVKELQKHPS